MERLINKEKENNDCWLITRTRYIPATYPLLSLFDWKFGEYFELKDFNIQELKEKAKKNKLITFTVVPLNGKPDVVGSKILKVFNLFNDKIKREGFKIIESKWQWKDNALLYYIVKNEKLSNIFNSFDSPEDVYCNLLGERDW